MFWKGSTVQGLRARTKARVEGQRYRVEVLGAERTELGLYEIRSDM